MWRWVSIWFKSLSFYCKPAWGNQSSDTRISGRTSEYVTMDWLVLPGGGLSGKDHTAGGWGEELSLRRPWSGRELEPLRLARPPWACLAGRPSASESSVMFRQGVTRALRKNKTLRYGVPMLVSALRKRCGGGIAEGVGLQIRLVGFVRRQR